MQRWKAVAVVAIAASFLGAGSAGAQQTISGSLTGAPVVQGGTMNFGAQPVGTTGSAQTETLTAHLFTPTPPLPGGTSVRIVSVTSDTGEFQVTGGTCTPGALLPDGGTCSVDLAFTPAAAGARAGGLSIRCAVATAVGAISFACDDAVHQFMLLAGLGQAIAQTAVPTLGAVGLTALALLLLAFSLRYLRRR